MLTRQGIANELVKREWHCPWCINRAIDSIETNFVRGNSYAREGGLSVQEVRLFHEVSSTGIGKQASLGVHMMMNHEGPLWAPSEIPYASP